jgi:iron complex outermembrane receptor protein/vitamin B12 transporter
LLCAVTAHAVVVRGKVPEQTGIEQIKRTNFEYAKLDANITYAILPRATLFTEMDNLLNQQHIGPIGYPGLPFTIRAGMKVWLGGD